jgi:hypothetical protein
VGFAASALSAVDRSQDRATAALLLNDGTPADIKVFATCTEEKEKRYDD